LELGFCIIHSRDRLKPISLVSAETVAKTRETYGRNRTLGGRGMSRFWQWPQHSVAGTWPTLCTFGRRPQLC